MSAYLDTHVTLWLYAGETTRISKRAAALINREALLASPIVLLELQYLREIGRLAATPHAVVAELKRRMGLAVQNRPLDAIVEQAQDLDWTRDVFDRLIVAQAALDGAALVTTDRAIRKHYPKAVW
jgi:PIN domain nuclease of toxin-antitoxin system